MKKLFFKASFLCGVLLGSASGNVKAGYEIFDKDNWKDQVNSSAFRYPLVNQSDFELKVSIKYSVRGIDRDGATKCFLKRERNIIIPARYVAIFTPVKVVRMPINTEEFNEYTVTDYSIYTVKEKNTGTIYEEKDLISLPESITPIEKLVFTAYEELTAPVRISNLLRLNITPPKNNF